MVALLFVFYSNVAAVAAAAAGRSRRSDVGGGGLCELLVVVQGSGSVGSGAATLGQYDLWQKMEAGRLELTSR